MGNLRGSRDNNPSVFHIGGADIVFQVAVLDGGGVIPALHAQQTRLLDGGGVISSANLGMPHHVARIPLMQLGGVRREGLLRVQHKGIFLVLHPHQPRGLGRRDLVLRHDNGDILAVIAHVPGQQQPVCHVLMGRVGGPGVSGGGEIIFRHVKAGEDPHHPRHFFRRGGIN